AQIVPPATVPRSSFFMVSLLSVCVLSLMSACREGDQHFLDLELPQVGAGGGQTGAGGGHGGQQGAQIVPPAMVPRVFRSSVFIGAVLKSGTGLVSR
ncbi:hypothetical protein CS379_04125, partial [Methylobacterium frigidaeris]